MKARGEHPRRLLVHGLLVGAVTLLAGAAIVRGALLQQIAERRVTAERVALVRVEALDREIETIQQALHALWVEVRMAPSNDGFAMRAAPVAQLVPAVRNFMLVSGGTLRSAYPTAEDATVPDAMAKFEWRDPGATDAVPELASGAALLGPARLRRGDNVVVMRVPAPTAASGSGGAGWIAAVVPLDRMLRSAALASLGTDGYDYQLLHVELPGGQTRAIAQGPEIPQYPVEREVPRSGRQWRVAIAPHGGWIAWPALASNSLLAAIFALVAGLGTLQVAGRSARARIVEEKRRQRLRDAKRRLVEEIQQREEVERQYSYAGYHDALTGLPNRTFFVHRLERGLRHARVESTYKVAVLVVHFDRLKSINDSLGHAARDQLLMQASKRFEARLHPEEAVVAWLGGDDVALLLLDIRGRDSAIGAAMRLRETLTEPFRFEGHDLFTSVKMGIALSLSGYERADDLLRDAHVALSKATVDDSDGLAVFEPATRDYAARSLQVETDLHRALEHGELRLFFQPIVDLETSRMAGMEALLRWQHPLDGLVAPDKFIRVAEDTGLIVPITRWVMREACAISRTWRERLPAADFYVSVNLSPQDMRQPGLGDYVSDLLVETGMPTGRLRMEVTESSLISNFRSANLLVAQLRNIGVPLMLDDFGTGYSSLSYLERFQFDYLKIDQAFVSRIANPAKDSDVIVRAIIHMAADLGIQTVAEGIETRAMLERLRVLGCNYGQGFYFSRPIEQRAAFALLEADRPLTGTRPLPRHGKVAT